MWAVSEDQRTTFFESVRACRVTEGSLALTALSAKFVHHVGLDPGTSWSGIISHDRSAT